MDVFDKFKATQREGWAHFAPLQAITIEPAARLVKFAGIRPGHGVLDVACGTGVVAITAARHEAHVTALDLTPELLSVARDNAQLAGVAVDWHEGDVESLPFDADAFDVVVSQYGHIFAPRPDVAVKEMLRVLRPGGVLAFSTWPPELLVGQIFTITSKYMPPPPPGVASPALWGDPNVIRERLGTQVRDLTFDRATMLVPVLSLDHQRELFEQTAGPVRKLVEMLSATDPSKLEIYRGEIRALSATYYADNVLRQDYLMTRAIKS
jgi:SAM-dependent methyltransferase